MTRVEEHPVFKRRGDDFVVEVPISFVEAVLGAQIEVPRPGGGTVRVRLPAGTQDGKQFRVRGAGAPRTKKNGGENGDLIVRVGVVVPKKLKRREREILEALAEESGALLATTLLGKGLFDGNPFTLDIAGTFATDLADRRFGARTAG